MSTDVQGATKDNYTYQNNYLGLGEMRGEQLCDGKNSSCNLLRCVFVIVGSNPQHHHLDNTTDTHLVHFDRTDCNLQSSAQSMI